VDAPAMPGGAPAGMAGRVRLGGLSLREPVLFGLVGVLNTTIDICAYSVLVMAGMAPLLANVISFSLGATNSYMLNGKLTFWASGARTRSAETLLRFALMILVTLILSQAALWAALRLGIPPLPAKVVSVLLTFACGFVVSKFFVFRKREAR
jgi:putative flippase GtrA